MRVVSVRIPDDVKRALKAKAKREGTTMSELLRTELARQIALQFNVDKQPSACGSLLTDRV